MVFAYSGGINRSDQGKPFEFPGAMNDTTKGIGRIAKTFFSSKDQLVTLGFAGGPVAAFDGASYTGWQLGRAFGASMHNHVVGNPMGIVDAAADARNGMDWSDVTFIHATRWQDAPQAQIGSGASGYPNASRSKAWELVRDRGAHVSIANLIEMQMRHGMPPFQEALNHGILPSLSPDVDTNMTTDPFSLMRGAFCLQRALANCAVTYELNVYCANAQRMLEVYADMHRQILDVFNQYNVQIMTPLYIADPPEPKVVPPAQWYAAPAAAPQGTKAPG